MGRRGRLVAAAAVAGALACSLGATPAGAIVAKIRGHGFGVTPIKGVDPERLPGARRAPHPSPLSSTGVHRFDEAPFGGLPLTYHGGPVMHSNTTHVIYWDPNKEFSSTTKAIVNTFFTRVAHDSGLPTNVFSITGQYTDTTGNAAYSAGFAGENVDENVYPLSGCIPPPKGDPGPPYLTCLSDTQLQAELSRYITEKGLPRGPSHLYFLLLPHKVATCLEEELEGERVCSNNFFCAYHSYISPGTASEILYSDIPFSLLDTEKEDVKSCQADRNLKVQAPNGDTAGTNENTRFADVALKYISHEYIEAVTDPLVSAEVAGKELTAWVDSLGQEIGDKCNGVPYFPEEEGEPGFDKHAFTPTLGGSAAEGNLFNQSINEGHFYLQSEWDNAAGACLMRPLSTSPAFTVSTQPLAGAPVTFSGSSGDPYGAPAVTWSFGDGATASGGSASHAYGAPGSYTVTMTSKDTLTGSAAQAQRVVVVNDAPAASFALSPNPAVAGSPVAFDASASIDPDGSIVGYAWSFGDGTSGAGGTSSHTYAVAGSSTVTLTVTDSAGQTASVTRSLTVLPAPNSGFSLLAASFNRKTGAITYTLAVTDPGTFRWMLTFQNGKFGVFAAGKAKCASGLLRLNGRCRPARVLFGRGAKGVGVPGVARVTIKPSSAAVKALRNALKHGKGVPITATLTFQSSRGGAPFSRTRSLTGRLKKR